MFQNYFFRCFQSCRKLKSLLLLSFLSLFISSIPAFASQEVSFSWLPNSENNLAGYKIYYSTESGNYNQVVDVGLPEAIDGLVHGAVSALEAGQTYYFAAVAYNTDGLESDFSDEVVWTCPVEPEPEPVIKPAPEASDISIAINEDTLGTGQFEGVGQTELGLTYEIVANGEHGVATLIDSAAGMFTYQPDVNYYGKDVFTYQVSDENGVSAPATVSVSIAPVNDIPVAFDAELVVSSSKTVTGTLLGNDIDSSVLTYSLVGQSSLGTVELDSATGSYAFTPFMGVSGSDSFSFVANDGFANSELATVKITIDPVEPVFALEMSQVKVNGDWQRVEFDKAFVDPVVVAKPASNNDPDPCVVRIRNIDYTGFEIRLQAWDYLNISHGEELINYVVMERGSFTLDDGTLVEAGRLTTDKTSTYEAVIFDQLFNSVPVVSASVVSANEEEAVVGRISGINESGFGYKLREQELNTLEHSVETINFIAWEPSVGLIDDLSYAVGTTGDAVTHEWYFLDFAGEFTDVPVFVADMQTVNGGDSANLRYEILTAASVNIKVAEEESLDTEVSHVTENVGFMAFALLDLLGDDDNDGLTSGDELMVYGTKPALADSDADGLEDGVELDFWGIDWNADFDNDGLINLLDSDSDGDGYSDGVEVVSGTDPGDANSITYGPAVETGIIDVTSDWQQVSFVKQFVDPVVVAKKVSDNESDYSVVRIDNITATGFAIRLQEWEYLDGMHGIEQVSYIVMERGSYTLEDGTKVEAGKFSSNEMVSFDAISFKETFNVVPVVTASVVTANEAGAVTNRIRSISTTGLEFKMQEQEVNEKVHAVETISYIAWEPSAGVIDGIDYEINKTADTVTHKGTGIDFAGSYVDSPVVIADMQTMDGSDTSVVRCFNSNMDGVDVMIDEEESRDAEVNHTKEVVGYMVFASE
ncbi:MAG: cadherin-like domain-containing protein [Desulfobulbaceae bacterium]|nr:cadherin-like domain-containing protein [Desulfobulbaceae bacterium]